MEVAYRSDIGKIRDLDEDSILVIRIDSVYSSIRQERALFILADGMGGHNAGEVASSLAVRKIAEYLFPTLISLADVDWSLALRSGIKEVNKSVIDYGIKNPEFQGMGTTLVVAILIDRKLYVGNIGDSRLYLINGNRKEIRQVTKDHSLVQKLVDNGKITKEEARDHPQKNIITRAIGCFPEVEADTFELDLERDDIILLCCDGLTDVVDDDEIKEIVLRNKDIQKVCDELIKAANDRGGPDNISVILAM